MTFFCFSTSPTAQQETSQRISISLTTVYSLGTRLHVRMRIRKQLENDILCNRQQLLSIVNGFIDQSEFEVMKMLSGHGGRCYDKHQFLDDEHVQDQNTLF